jgi:hypothetical protein
MNLLSFSSVRLPEAQLLFKRVEESGQKAVSGANIPLLVSKRLYDRFNF